MLLFVMNILGIRIDNLNKKEILARIETFLAEEKFHQIATVNPEFVLAAQKDQEFKKILNDCDLNVADGIGIWYAFLKHFKLLRCRIAGADLMEEILKIANEKYARIFLAMAKKGLSSYEEIKNTLEKKYPNLIIDGENIHDLDFKSYKIQNTGYEILLCNFGAPYQEKFLNQQKNVNIKLTMGIGGAFDFLTGKVKRSPKIMRKLGLEWFWRLMQEPKYRAKRIFNAVVIFPIRIILNK